jgi:F-type H+-transporting ATPase subunit b
MRVVVSGVSLGLLAAAVPAAASEGGGAAALIQPQIGTMFWTLVTFLVLVVLLGRFAWKPLIGAIDERERAIRDRVESSQRDREQAGALLRQHHELLDQARRERAAAVEQGQRDGERLKSEILEQASRQREQLLRDADVQLQSTLREARREMRAHAATLAIHAAEKLLSQQLDDAAHRRLVEDHLADLERSSPAGSPPS